MGKEKPTHILKMSMMPFAKEFKANERKKKKKNKRPVEMETSIFITLMNSMNLMVARVYRWTTPNKFDFSQPMPMPIVVIYLALCVIIWHEWCTWYDAHIFFFFFESIQNLQELQSEVASKIIIPIKDVVCRVRFDIDMRSVVVFIFPAHSGEMGSYKFDVFSSQIFQKIQK